MTVRRRPGSAPFPHRPTTITTRTPSGRSPAPVLGNLAPRLLRSADGCSAPPRDLPVRFGDCILQANILHRFPANRELDDDLVAEVLLGLRRDDPVTYGFTPAPEGRVRMPGEYEPVASVRMVYPGWPDHDEFYADLIAATVGHGEVHIQLLHRGDRRRLDDLLDRRRVSREQLRIHTSPSVDSIWIRDYGPLSVFVGGQLAAVDGRYNVDCVNDDALPTRLAVRSGIPTLRPPILLEGGNLLSDGQGTCFTTHHLSTVNRLSDAELAWLLERYLGCSRVVFLEPLIGDVIEHVDMFLSVADPETLLLAEADPLLDPDNDKVLSENLARLRALEGPGGRPYRILRVPLPPPLAHNPENSRPHYVRTYLNLLPFNGVVLVPSYRSDPLVEREALRTIRSAFPSRQIRTIPADTIAASYGTIHCATQTTPR